MDTKPGTNLLIGTFSTSKVGLAYMFVAVAGLGFALIAAGSLAFISSSELKAKLESAKNAFRASQVQAIVSNEKANPGTLAVYLNDTFAGALTDDGVYSPAEKVPPEGPLAILPVNPTDTALPTNAEFPAQSLTITADTGTLTVCLPKITGGRTLWVGRNGNTYLDLYLTQLARAC